MKINKQCKYNSLRYISVLLILRSYVLMLAPAFTAQSVFSDEYEEYEMINFTAGQVGVLDDSKATQRYGLEYRFTSFSGPYGLRIIPAIGIAGANDGAKFIYTDLRHDFYLARRWILIPSFGVGLFKDGSKIDLGNNIEFRSGVEIAYQFRNKVRTGFAIFHLSNGGISNDNPGTEALVFSVCIPAFMMR